MADPIATSNLTSQFTGPPARKHPMANIKSEASDGRGGQRMVQMSERSVNKAILVGRAGSDAETFFTKSGKPVSKVSLAMNRQWMDSSRQIHEETDWVSVVLWNRENLAQYLIKGTRLYVEGRLQARSYEDKDGIRRHVTEVVAESVILLGGNGNGSAHERRPSPEHAANGHIEEPRTDAGQPEDWDVPF
jgi:single-strand DNA-binding protein